jgi:hypothetical protein
MAAPHAASRLCPRCVAVAKREKRPTMVATETLDQNDRVRRHTDERVQQTIDERTRSNVRYHAMQPRERIDARIEELERTWDVERTLETNASILALTGAALGVLGGRKWFFLTGGVLGFLLQHALSGWCPPIPIFRRLGVRTQNEVDQEKYALKALRGDFREASRDNKSAADVLQAVGGPNYVHPSSS